MVLPNAVLIPNSLLPLHIFEPRYREMLRWCLERERLFCIAMMKEDGAEEPENFREVGGIGLVRACVAVEDGTSNLVLQGLARVEFGELVQRAPFRIAEVREFESDCPNVVEADALGVKVVEICAKLQEQGREGQSAVVEKLRHVANPELLADLVTQAFVREPGEQQRVLEERSVSERLRILMRYLGGVGGIDE